MVLGSFGDTVSFGGRYMLDKLEFLGALPRLTPIMGGTPEK